MATNGRVTRMTLAGQVEDALRVDIIEGVLVPGQRLRASDLAQTYGVSATPLREALQRLAAQKLVDLDPRMGATVADISHSDLRDIYWLRELLEPLALERSIGLGDEAWVARVGRSWQAFRNAAEASEAAPEDDTTRDLTLGWSSAHRTFHEALFSACDSPWLLRFVQTLYDHSERYRMITVRRRTRHTIDEHASIYQPAVKRDAKAAVAALRQHLENTVSALEAGLQSHTAGTASEPPQAEQTASSR